MEKAIEIGGKPVTLHGRTFVGTVTSDKMMNTVTVEWERRRYVTKYQRYEKRSSSVKAHNPKEMHAKTGDIVRIVESRPISKTKNFVVVEIITSATHVEEKESSSKKSTKKATAKTAKKVAKKTTNASE